ncbi:MAG: Maf family nucleotide pyrophosphatase [Candidatus Accumulibacter sp.]|nr:Maf family nucleotide pyrophosphatase [Accumulibacter sp.]
MPASRIVLASTSPFRRQLLDRLKIPFDVADPRIDEGARPDESPEQTALRLSEEKARAVAKIHPDALIIGSDQVACLDGEIFGKPLTHQNAVRQLQKMRGRVVTFHTGVCLLNAQSGVARVRNVPTRVGFRALCDEEIENYLRKEQPYDCAGSAKSEELGIALVTKIESDDPTALVGLPLITLTELLREEGVNPLIRNQVSGIRSVSGGVAADQVSDVRNQGSDQSAATSPPE